MGNCIVIQRSTQSASKLEWSPNPMKENRLCSDLNLNPQYSPPMPHVASFQEFSGSKDEIFFDANVLMDSDCDDFFSVTAGTPQCTTPVHPMAKSFTEAPPRLDKSVYVMDTSNSTPQHSPTEVKQLIELFRESFSGDVADRDQYLQGIMEMKPPSPASNVQSTPPRRHKSPQCCLPSLVRSLSMSDKKKRASFTHSTG